MADLITWTELVCLSNRNEEINRATILTSLKMSINLVNEGEK